MKHLSGYRFPNKNYQEQNSVADQSKPDGGTNHCRSGALPKPEAEKPLEYHVGRRPDIKKKKNQEEVYPDLHSWGTDLEMQDTKLTFSLMTQVKLFRNG